MLLSRRVVVAQYLGLALAQALDWATTHVGLTHGAVETNHFALAIITEFGMGWMLAAKIFIGSFLVGTIFRRKPTIVWLIVILHMGVALNNLYVLQHLLKQ